MEKREDFSRLYDQDFFEWTQLRGKLLRQGCFERADWEHIAEEIEDLGNRDQRAVESRLRVLLLHLLKWQFQPQRRYSRSGKSSWLDTVVEQRQQLRSVFQQSPSLKNFAGSVFAAIYRVAVQRASAQTGLPIGAFPDGCPFSFDQILADEFLPK